MSALDLSSQSAYSLWKIVILAGIQVFHSWRAVLKVEHFASSRRLEQQADTAMVNVSENCM